MGSQVIIKKRAGEDDWLIDWLRFRMRMGILLKRPLGHPVEVTNIYNSLRVKEGRIQFHVPNTVAKNLVSVICILYKRRLAIVWMRKEVMWWRCTSKENCLGHPCKQYTEQPWIKKKKEDKKIKREKMLFGDVYYLELKGKKTCSSTEFKAHNAIE